MPFNAFRPEVADDFENPPAGKPAQILDLMDARVERMIPKKEQTGAYKEALSKEAYLAELQEIAAFKIPAFEGDSHEGLSKQEVEALIGVSLARMNETDATDVQKKPQEQHLRDVYKMVSTGIDLMLERDPSLKINKKAVEKAALLHDTCKFCAGYKASDSGPQVIKKESAEKPTANPDLFGHNAKSAIDSRVIGELSGDDAVEQNTVAKIILLHSTDEFPDKQALTTTSPVVKTDEIEVYIMKNPPPFEPTYFVRGTIDDLEAQVMHSADLLVGAGTESYGKYLEQHAKNDYIIDVIDKKAMVERGWTRFQAALQSCFDSSAENYLNAPVATMRRAFGLRKIAEAQAVREWFEREAVGNPEAQELIDIITIADYKNVAHKDQVAAAYTTLLEMAKQYLASHQESPDFTNRYAREFLERQLVQNENDRSYYESRQPVDGLERLYYLGKLEEWRTKIQQELAELPV